MGTGRLIGYNYTTLATVTQGVHRVVGWLQSSQSQHHAMTPEGTSPTTQSGQYTGSTVTEYETVSSSIGPAVSRMSRAIHSACSASVIPCTEGSR